MIYLLHHSVTESARRFPEKQAFVWVNQSYSYSELDQKSNQLANYLIENGVEKGDRVGIFMGRSLETALAVYGILKAGAAFVPLDPGAPPSRINFLLGNCGIEHVITTKLYKKPLQEALATKPTLKSIVGLAGEYANPTVAWEQIFELDSTAPDIDLLESDLAYIMYTSGTTGAPKGIMHTHRSGLNYARLTADLYNINETDRIANHASLFFDISTLGYFTAPFVGATTVLVTEAHTKMPASQASLMEKEHITIWYSVPLALSQMVTADVLKDKKMEALRYVFFGGEPFPPKALRYLMQQWPQATFSNIYGPAEVNQCTYYNLPGPPENDAPIPLGTVWDNTEKLIVNENDQPVNAGEMGELLIRSVTMMNGYWNQPELTAKGLYKTTGNSGIQKVYYRTGDLVKEDRDGIMHFFGRKDRQVKIRGYRVELEEVTSAIQAHPQIEEATVFTVNTNENTRRLEAVLVAGELEIENVRKFLSDKLPPYAIPEVIRVIDALPRTNAGKVDFRKLQEMA